jgi:sirohydrochlorin ferrochelatase
MNILKITLFAFLFISFIACNPSQEPPKKTGVLVLSHGSRDTTWNNTVQRAVAPIAEKYTLEKAFGMANPYSMQPAIDSLEAKGVEQIVVIPLFVSSHSSIIRQNEFLLGLRDSLADAPMPPMAHEMTDDMMTMMNHDHHEEFVLEPLEVESDIVFSEPLDDHPLVAEILMDRITEMSDNPEEETILLVAHGPVKDNDNKMWEAEISSLGEQIQRMQSDLGKAPFYNIVSMTVRDDAEQEIYDAATQKFREAVIEANQHGEALVVPLLLSSGGVERRYLTRLEGLEYTWHGKTLLPHNNITTFIEQSVEKALRSK